MKLTGKLKSLVIITGVIIFTISWFFYKKATIDQLDHEGFTPLMRATYEGDINKVKGLLIFSADVNFKDSEDGFTPLYSATASNQIEIVRLLLENGADPLVKDNSGNTALMIAQNKGFTEITNLIETQIAKNKNDLK